MRVAAVAAVGLVSLGLTASVELRINQEIKKQFAAKSFTKTNETVPFVYPLFSQCDKVWGDDMMVTKTVCDVGCLMSSTSMALSGTGILIPTTSTSVTQSNPGSLNTWLKANGGYDDSNDFIESVAHEIDTSRVFWPSDAMHSTNDLSFATIVGYLEKGRIVIANVNSGHHFVLVVGYSADGDTLIVNDPGYDRDAYSYGKDIVGWRLFDMVRV